MPRLYVEPEAEADLDAAFGWYEGQRPGLGSEFLAEVAHVFMQVEEAPFQDWNDLERQLPSLLMRAWMQL